MCAVVVRIEDNKLNAANIKYNRGENDLQFLDQCTYHDLEISKDCSPDTLTSKVMGKEKSQVGKMYAVLTDAHLDTMIEL